MPSNRKLPRTQEAKIRAKQIKTAVRKLKQKIKFLTRGLWPPIEIGQPANQLLLLEQGLTPTVNNLL